MSTNAVSKTENRKMVVTLGIKAARLTRDLAAKQEASYPEVVRRGLTLLNLFVTLDKDQDLMIVNRRTGETERLKPLWI